jgi:hypothetical protein
VIPARSQSLQIDSLPDGVSLEGLKISVYPALKAFFFSGFARAKMENRWEDFRSHSKINLEHAEEAGKRALLRIKKVNK